MAEEVEEEVEDILKGIRDLLQKEREEKDNVFEITYPPEGGTKTITAGNTELNLYTGEVFLADGTEEKISQSLRSYGVEYARSVVIDADKTITVQLDDSGKHTVNVDKEYAQSPTKFQRVSITVDESTKIKFWASTSPNATLEVAKTRGVLILKDSKFNISVTADTNIFSSDLTPSYSDTIFRIYACFDTAGVLSVKRTESGVTITEKLKEGGNLSADCAYSFDIIVESGETINLQYSAAATALKLTISEIGGST